jgi:hypothetical protein
VQLGKHEHLAIITRDCLRSRVKRDSSKRPKTRELSEVQMKATGVESSEF